MKQIKRFKSFKKLKSSEVKTTDLKDSQQKHDAFKEMINTIKKVSGSTEAQKTQDINGN